MANDHDFSSSPWKVDEAGYVVEPVQFGDAELVSVEMSLERVILSFGAQFYDEIRGLYPVSFKVVCGEASFIKMDSDHLQNVVDNLWIFDDIAKAREMKRFGDGAPLFPNSYPSPTAFPVDDKFYIFLTPITGIELFVACRTVDILVGPAHQEAET